MMIPELNINPKIAAYQKEIHRLQTIVDKWNELRDNSNGESTLRKKFDLFSVWLDLCFLKDELIRYEKFLIRKLKNNQAITRN